MVGQQSAWESVTWFLSGFLLTTAWLFFFMGGFILMGLMLLAVPAMLLVVGVVRVVGLSERQVAHVVAKELVAAPALVGVRVLEASGICSRGMQYVVGSEYQFANGKPSPEMCGPVTHAIQPAVKLVRHGQPATSINIQCPLSGYVLSLEVYRKEGQVAEMKRAA